MKTKTAIALALATAFGVSMSGAYADYDHDRGRDYRHEHRDSREYRRDEHREYVRRDYGGHGYVASRPGYVAPPVVYAPPVLSGGVNIVVPLNF